MPVSATAVLHAEFLLKEQQLPNTQAALLAAMPGSDASRWSFGR